MDKTHVVDRLDGGAEVERPAARGGEVERLALGHDVAQASSFDELHDDEGLTGPGFPEFQNADQSRVGRRPGRDRPAHALDPPHDVRLGGQLARQESNRDSLGGRLVFGDTNGPESAGSQLADDAVAIENPLPDTSAHAHVIVHDGLSATP